MGEGIPAGAWQGSITAGDSVRRIKKENAGNFQGGESLADSCERQKEPFGKGTSKIVWRLGARFVESKENREGAEEGDKLKQRKKGGKVQKSHGERGGGRRELGHL